MPTSHYSSVPPTQEIWDAIVVKTVTESLASSATLQDDNELFFPIVLGGLYIIEGIIAYDGASATPDFKWAFAQSGGGTMNREWIIHYGHGPTTSIFQGGQDDDIEAVVVNASVSVASPALIYFLASTVVQTAAGTLKFQWAQNTSSVDATRVLAGSLLRYKRIATA